jgi:folylpolyglutamate synthase/dihydropteroate synthase
MRAFPLVLGAMRGKRVTAVLRALAPLRPAPIFTRIDDHNAIPPARLLAAWRRIGGEGGVAVDDPADAIQRAAGARASADQPIVVAGSLYLVGAVRAMLAGEEAPQ